MNAPVSEFQAQAAAFALTRMFGESKWFDICIVDTVGKMLGRPLSGREYDALRLFHCVHWHDMPAGMPGQIRDKVIELLAISPFDALPAGIETLAKAPERTLLCKLGLRS